MLFNFVNVMISTYPRKGTETESFMELSYNQAKFNLSPQGDGNWNTPE